MYLRRASPCSVHSYFIGTFAAERGVSQSTDHLLRIPRSGYAIFLWFAACNTSEKAREPSRTTLTSDSIAVSIDRSVADLRRDTATVLDLSAEGATVEAAYRDTTLRRLRAVYLGEAGRATETFYFDSSLMLVVRGEVRYDVPLSGRIADSTTKRFDLRSASTPQTVRDSLQHEAQALLGHLASARKP